MTPLRSPIAPAAPWYRHRWPWLLMAGPFIVIVAAAITVWLALRSNDGLVTDDYYKQGLAINQVTARDRQAAALGVTAVVSIDSARRLLRVSLQPGKLAQLPESLLLTLSHPTRSGLDQSFRLTLAEESGLYAAPLTADIAGRWHVVLQDNSRAWRLIAEWDTAKQGELFFGRSPG
jgi:hypothetical protein